LATVSSCRRCEHTRRQSWPIGCRIVNWPPTAVLCVRIRRQSSRIHVHTADATKQFRLVGGVYWALERWLANWCDCFVFPPCVQFVAAADLAWKVKRSSVYLWTRTPLISPCQYWCWSCVKLQVSVTVSVRWSARLIAHTLYHQWLIWRSCNLFNVMIARWSICAV